MREREGEREGERERECVCVQFPRRKCTIEHTYCARAFPAKNSGISRGRASLLREEFMQQQQQQCLSRFLVCYIKRCEKFVVLLG